MPLILPVLFVCVVFLTMVVVTQKLPHALPYINITLYINVVGGFMQRTKIPANRLVNTALPLLYPIYGSRLLAKWKDFVYIQEPSLTFFNTLDFLTCWMLPCFAPPPPPFFLTLS